MNLKRKIGVVLAAIPVIVFIATELWIEAQHYGWLIVISGFIVALLFLGMFVTGVWLLTAPRRMK